MMSRLALLLLLGYNRTLRDEDIHGPPTRIIYSCLYHTRVGSRG